VLVACFSRQYANTPLHTAAYLGHLAIAERLLEAGAPVDAENSTGSTPMHLAAEGGHLAVIERLLEAGAEADLPNNVHNPFAISRDHLIRKP
jgi:ankyrin repeat protein